MKLIKKIAAIMFAFMMVFSLSTNVNAESGKYEDSDGKITISNAVKDQTYTIYRMLKLESFDGTNYSYTLENGWDNFISTGAGKDYLEKNSDGYIIFKSEKNNETDMRLFAKAAFAYAKTAKLNDDAKKSVKAALTSVTFEGLPLGYYVVGSTVGSLCELKTTNKEVTITDKNDTPTVEKKIVKYNEDHSENLVDSNSANIGEEVVFKTTIDIKPGAKNYILHDKMDSHLRYDCILQIHDNNDNNIAADTGYVVKTTGLTDADCTFELSFTEAFYANNRDNIDTKKLNKIYVYYQATVKDDAVVKQEMKNNTYLTFGENNIKSNEDYTTTKTFEIPVFKYTGTDTALAGAKFILSTDPNCTDSTKTLKFKLNSDNKYRYDTNGTTELASLTDGMIHIEGIKAGTYYLKETEAPKGYNLLKTIQMIEILEDGSIKLNGTENKGNVRVQNNKGSLLPSTGGMGTTLIYLIGGALVLGSGIVLMNKKRAKAK
ncbi:SpaA isopeptide-forming pilin-related protein [Holdemanella biformis]|uniref:SpaA isopeptide-forming pilin-related protein n=1 Tax=Holdemanella biformis TaxID=1735 RepID=UPI002E76B3CE|nr:SpaA isopeptide-forming pilin-related protein [Holdemanella biformis]MEE0667117.1 SpaA isopeptide-forming pilin-related protein [Holdemanella biformis]